MIKTEKITAKELEQRMRKMEIGTAIDLVRKQNDEEQWYGIRRLPDNMLDNGSCWIADVYGGGAARVFTDGAHGVSLKSQLFTWLFMVHLMGDDGETVQVAIKDGTEQEIRYDFQRTVVEPQKNRMACVYFTLARNYRTYVSVRPTATDDEVIELAKNSIMDCGLEEFRNNVIDVDAACWDVFPEDFVDITVDPECNQTNGIEEDLPLGTLGT